MEVILRFERDEVSRVFGGLGTIVGNLIGQARTPPFMPADPDAMIGTGVVDAAGLIRNATVNQGGQRQIRSMADVADFMARFQDGRGTPLLPSRAEGECQHEYVFLQTEHGQDIYACHRAGCDKRLAIPGRIIQAAPTEETTEVISDEERSRDPPPQLPGLPPGEQPTDPPG
ncbi:hypothetical protein ES703_53479 [subsurface metagenome]